MALRGAWDHEKPTMLKAGMAHPGIGCQDQHSFRLPGDITILILSGFEVNWDCSTLDHA
jgi:hypothetical protein